MNLKVKKDQSHGIIPFCQIDRAWHVLLIQHKSAHYWGFPKGHAELNENSKEAATRELKEETNLDIEYFFSDEAFPVFYQFVHEDSLISKTVFFFSAVVKGELALQQEEVSACRFESFSKALSLLTYNTDKSALEKAIELFFSKI